MLPERIPDERTKSRSLDYPLVPFILRWLKEIPSAKRIKGMFYLFPKSDVRGICREVARPVWNEHARRQTTWDIIQNFEPTWWSHLLRHSLAVRFLDAGYTEKDLQDFFDWASLATVSEYTALGGKKTIRKMGDQKV
jgi:site-specific recombinase XerD